MNIYIKKISFILTVALILAGIFIGYKVVQAATGGGTATIAVDGGSQGAGVTVVQSTSHIFTAVLTINVSGMTLGAASPTFTIPTGFTAPNLHAVATAGDVNADGKWSVVAGGPGGCTVDSAPGSLTTVASGQTITVDITADCAATNTITLTYQGTSSITMGATALTVSTADAGDPGPVTPLIAGSPTITVTAAAATLNVIKHVVNDNGGTAVAGAWTLAVSSSNSGTGTGSAAGSEAGTTYTLQVGKQYSVTESGGPSGYLESGSADCAIASAVGGTTYNCTITNDDIAPRLIVTKVVVGGTKVISDFPLFIDGGSVTSGVTNTTTVGSHTVSETSASNYTSVIGGDCAANGTITLALSDLKTCTITNTYVSPPASGGAGLSPAPVPPLIDLVKVPNPLALPNGPGSVTYTYTLRNIGTVPVTDITMVGDTCSPIKLISGDKNNNAKLEVNEIWTYNCFTTLSKTHTNIVTATGWANGISAVDIASATVVVGLPVIPPLIHVTKIPSPLLLQAIGGTITYTNKVTNPGTVPLSNVRLTDDKCAPVKYISGDTNGDSKLGVSETWTYTCKSNLIQTTTNTVTAKGDANGLTATDFAIATVVVANTAATVTAAPKLPKTGFPPQEKYDFIKNLLKILSTYY